MKRSNLVRDENGWQTISSQTHFTGEHLQVVTDTVRTPTRPEPKTWTIVHRKAAVVIAGMTRTGKFLLVHQERVPIRATIWEMPAGQIDEELPDQREIEAVALRELSEETGYELAANGELISLGHYFCSPGFTDEHCYFFLARPVEQGAAPPEEESIVECREFSAGQLREMIGANEIRDANTLSICARLAARGFLALGPED